MDSYIDWINLLRPRGLVELTPILPVVCKVTTKAESTVIYVFQMTNCDLMSLVLLYTLKITKNAKTLK